jgi:hypothetical protein
MKKNKVNAEKVLRQFRESRYNMSEPKQSLPKAQLGLFGKKKDAHCVQKYSGPTKYSKGCESIQEGLEPGGRLLSKRQMRKLNQPTNVGKAISNTLDQGVDWVQDKWRYGNNLVKAGMIAAPAAAATAAQLIYNQIQKAKERRGG